MSWKLLHSFQWRCFHSWIKISSWSDWMDPFPDRGEKKEQSLFMTWWDWVLAVCLSVWALSSSSSSFCLGRACTGSTGCRVKPAGGEERPPARWHWRQPGCPPPVFCSTWRRLGSGPACSCMAPYHSASEIYHHPGSADSTSRRCVCSSYTASGHSLGSSRCTHHTWGTAWWANQSHCMTGPCSLRQAMMMS